MQLSIKEIAQIINAQIIGDDTLIINKVSSFNEADKQALTFASDLKFLKKLDKSEAGAIIVPADYEIPEGIKIEPALLKTTKPKYNFFKIIKLFNPEKVFRKNISTNAHIGKNVEFGKDISIYNNVYVGDNVLLGDNVVLMPNVYLGDNVKIGANTIVKPNTTIMENSEIGCSVLIHSGTVIGSDGFGFTQHNQKHEKMIHAGNVCIGDNVEIGACNTIDRGTFGKTWLKNGVKTDNLVHIAHNVIIDENSLVIAQAGIAGSSTIGKNVIIAGRSGISGHITIGDNSIVGPGAGVLNDVPPNKIVSGIPEVPHKLWLKISRILPRLPELRKKLFSLERRMEKIEKNKN
ncbi:MAG: UDP-3-O-(3-hydroxymyristoyl)glucosamine N-acyltransferase [Desulfobacteraceae bacterium]|nr:UDP-3-O-(3-hydroxymyristoyl)glucosamine N-acyltransferase [Desulfobacteraceae bacterium]